MAPWKAKIFREMQANGIWHISRNGPGKKQKTASLSLITQEKLKKFKVQIMHWAEITKQQDIYEFKK